MEEGWKPPDKGRGPMEDERTPQDGSPNDDSPDGEAIGHLTTEEIAGYLERALSAAERTKVEEHLTECVSCREDVAQAWDLFRPSGRRRSWLLAIPPAAAAAVIAFILLAQPPGAAPPQPGEGALRGSERGSEREAVGSIVPVTPEPEASVDPDAVTFAWRGIEGEPSYTLTLTADDGTAVWTGSTTETALSLPPEIRLEAGRLYFWYVDALLADGRSATTGVQRFTASR